MDDRWFRLGDHGRYLERWNETANSIHGSSPFGLDDSLSNSMLVGFKRDVSIPNGNKSTCSHARGESKNERHMGESNSQMDRFYGRSA